jgi:hypothetical protein
VPTTSHGWRSLFWFGSAPPILIIAFRWWLPETNTFQVMKAEREAQLIADQDCGGQTHVTAAGYKAWLRESWTAIKLNWVLFVRVRPPPHFPTADEPWTGIHGYPHDWLQFLQSRKASHCIVHVGSHHQKLNCPTVKTCTQHSSRIKSCWVLPTSQ